MAIGEQRMCSIPGCPSPALETKDTCAGHSGLTPHPSKASMEAARYLLAVPPEVLQVFALLESNAKTLEQIELTLRALCEALGAKLPPLPTPVAEVIPQVGPEPKNYFLNEAHETHVTKSQARRERKEARERAQAEAKKAPAPRSKSRARSVRRGR